MNSKLQQAWQLLESGQFDDALKIAEEVCSGDLVDADSTYILGCCQSQLGRHAQALSSFEQSLLYKPDVVHVYIAIGKTHSIKKNMNKAAEHYEKALSIEPTHLLARTELARMLALSGDFDSARQELLTAQENNPNSGLPPYRLSTLGRQTNMPLSEIHQHLLNAVNLEPGVAKFQYALSAHLMSQHLYDQTKDHLSIAYKIEPDNPAILSGLAVVSVKQGNMEFAFEQINKLQNRDIYLPDVALAYLLCCKHVDQCDKAIEYAKICLNDTTLDSDMSRNIHSKLAAVLDNNEQYDEAWHHLIVSKDDNIVINDGTNVSHENYDPAEFRVYVDNLIETLHFANMFKLPRSNIEHEHSPIFIIGMPRSGTSLTEQILAAHPEVTGGGELTFIQSIIDNLPNTTNSSQTWPFCILDMGQDEINLMTKSYLENISQIAEDTPYVTDKMPHNFYAVGLIRLLFPKAKIIHCKRDPLDTCISIFFQNFKEGHEYSNNLFHLGTHYHQYQRLMEHWKTSLSFDMHEINYEDIVLSPKQTISKMLDYCNLDWDDRCMNFNKVKRYVLTASFDQVRQPLHNRSVDRWRHYEQHLGDLKEGFKRGF